MTKFNDRLDEFKEKGYTVFEGLHSDRITTWKQIMHEKIAEQKDTRDGLGRFIFRDFLEEKADTLLADISNPHLLDFLEKLMGPLFQMESVHFVATRPTPPTQDEPGIAWHRDRWASAGRTTDYMPPNGVNVLTYLQDMNEQTGPLRVINGSHRQPVYISKAERGRPHVQETLVTPRAGDVLFLHSGALHSTSANRAEDHRYLVSFFYTRCWYPGRDDNRGPKIQRFIDRARARNDRRLLRLFTIDEQLIERAKVSGSLPEEQMWEKWIQEDRQALRTGS